MVAWLGTLLLDSPIWVVTALETEASGVTTHDGSSAAWTFSSDCTDGSMLSCG